MNRALFQVFGFRIAVIFGAICAMLVAVLSGLYLSSNYAIEGYVSRQLARLPWDVNVVQQGELASYEKLKQHLAAIPGVNRVETVGILRLQRGNDMIGIDVAGKPLDTRWVSFIAASDPALLPVDLRRSITGNPGNPSDGPLVQAAFITAGRNNADQINIAPGSMIRVHPMREHHEEIQDPAEAAEHEHAELAADIPDTLFQARIALPPTQVDRAEFNRLMLEKVGSLSYLPEDAVVLAVPLQGFQHLSSTLDHVFLNDEAVHGGDESPPYLPELSHLIKLDQAKLVDPWDLAASLENVSPILLKIQTESRSVTPFTFPSSDLYRLLAHMLEVSKLVNLVTLMVAIPLICLAWVVADLAGGLLIMHERRTIGLTLLRGVTVDAVGRTLNLALVGGGVIGSLIGLVVGIIVTVAGYSLLGHPVPTAAVFLRDAVYLAVLMVIGVGFSLLSGRRMVGRFKSMTPLAATARVASEDFEQGAARPSTAFVICAVIALLIGAYKILLWIAGHPAGEKLASQTGDRLPILPLLSSMSNFVAVPLFLFGAVSLLRIFRSSQYLTAMLAIPIGGKLGRFAASHMALNRRRVMSALFLTALAMAVTLLPQVSADSFFDRVTRGVRVSVGGDLKLEYNMVDLSDGHNDAAPVNQYRTMLAPKVQALEAALRRDHRVANVSSMQQYVVPAFYLPGQSDLFLDIISDRKSYLDTVYSEEGLGLTRPFSNTFGGPGSIGLSISQGFKEVRQVPIGQEVLLDDEDSNIGTRFDNVVAFLPGQPTATIADREGFAGAEVDYLNYLVASDARVIGTATQFDSTALRGLNVIPSRLVLMVKLAPGVSKADADNLVAGLPVRPDQVSSLATEVPKLSEDMFVALSLENMKVLIVGGALLAMAGIVALNLANYISDRRLMSLLRVRGVPPGLVLRLALAIFLVPVLLGLVIGALLGTVAGLGNSDAIWRLPRVYGVAGLLENHLAFTGHAVTLIVSMSVALIVVGVGVGLWPLREGAIKNLRDA